MVLSRSVELSRSEKYLKDWNTPAVLGIIDAKRMTLSRIGILTGVVFLSLFRSAGTISRD